MWISDIFPFIASLLLNFFDAITFRVFSGMSHAIIERFAFYPIEMKFGPYCWTGEFYFVDETSIFRPRVRVDYGVYPLQWTTQSYVPLKSLKELPVLLVFHGNACTMQATMEALAPLARRLNMNLVCMEYPGYGRDYGHRRPTEKMCVRAGIELLQILKSHTVSPIYILGHSLGSSIAAQVVAGSGMSHNLILVAPLYSALSMLSLSTVRSIQPEGFDAFRTHDAIARMISWQRIFVVCGSNDTVIPNSHAEALCREYANNTQLCLVENADHASMFDEAYLNSWVPELLEYFNPTAKTEGSAEKE